MTDDFHDELQALLVAEDARRGRDVLIESFRRRPVAGVFAFRYPLDDRAAWRVDIDWGDDLSGALDGIPVDEVVQRGLEATPAWLLRWVLRRRRPFHLRAASRFITFSTALILRNTAPPGRRPLKDLLVVPFHQVAAAAAP